MTADGVRDLLTYETAKMARLCGYPLVLVDSSPCEEFGQEMERLGATLYPSVGPKSMGADRRKALKMGSEMAGPDGAFFWLEPEKCTMVELLEPAFDLILDGGFDFVCVGRNSLKSYPDFQQKTEEVGNIAWRMATGVDFDTFCGVRGMNRNALPYFLDYDAKAAGAPDQWDGLHLPIMDVIVSGLRLTQIKVDYIHPPEQTEVEGTPRFLLKRAEQLGLLASTQFAYAKRLGLFKD
jgi:hypothetical protein